MPGMREVISLYAWPDDLKDAHLGPLEETDATLAEAFRRNVRWNTPIRCYDCYYYGRYDSFMGKGPSLLASYRRLILKTFCGVEVPKEEGTLPQPNDTAQTTGTIKVTRRSVISGKVTTLDLPITREELDAYLSGEDEDYLFPELAPPLREFIMSGITPEEWQHWVLGPSSDEPKEEDATAPSSTCPGGELPEEEGMLPQPNDTAQPTGTIKVTRRSVIIGKVTLLDLPITCQLLYAYLSKDMLAQDVFPELVLPLREFIMSGITPEELRYCILGPSSDEPKEEDAIAPSSTCPGGNGRAKCN
jgi:hypothetical protein